MSPAPLPRRAVLLGPPSAAAAAASTVPRPATAAPPSAAERAATASEAESPLVARLLAASREHKAANDAARAASYDRRNFQDYMAYEVGVSGAMRGVKPETRAAIQQWLERNK